MPTAIYELDPLSEKFYSVLNFYCFWIFLIIFTFLVVRVHLFFSFDT